MMRTFVCTVAAILLTACATAPTVYGPATSIDGVGYRETVIETNRYRVSFRANPDLSSSQVEDLALRRAAELASQQGAPWFQVVTRTTEQIGGNRGGGTSVGIGGSSGSYGSSVGVGLGIDLSPDTRKYETTMEILLGSGPRPSSANVYGTEEILNRIMPA